MEPTESKPESKTGHIDGRPVLPDNQCCANILFFFVCVFRNTQHNAFKRSEMQITRKIFKNRSLNVFQGNGFYSSNTVFLPEKPI